MNIYMQEHVSRIAAFDNVQDDLLRLDEDAGILFESGQAAHYLRMLFGLFERFPDEDNEVFWGIMHGLEATDGYESELLKSIQRQPSGMGLIMVNRMLNVNELIINETDLLELLRKVAADPTVTEVVRKYAHYFIEHQQQRTANGS